MRRERGREREDVACDAGVVGSGILGGGTKQRERRRNTDFSPSISSGSE